ncbi:MAG: FKBP-type peptidyl-prolyl cis-trans isomerase [Gemmatimonadetes bacterium]|nr:FKBP-type peptidyl-prolyl cis-trans isomerase [Gemmatimonadota bacterium]
MRTLFVIPMVFVLAACGGEDEGSTAPLTNADFAPELNVDLSAMTRTASGLYLQDLQVGAGDEAVAGTTVSVRYEGWFPNGTTFDSNEAYGFPLGAGLVIPGWDEGVVGMRVGGIRKLVIPPHLAYGAAGRGSIPSNATLVFDIELLSVTP